LEAKFPSEWSEFVALLVKHRARFLVVGAHALAAHGRPRMTADLDLWVEPSKLNSKRVCAALSDFGFGAFADFEWLATPERGVHGLQLGVEPLRLDLLKSISGVSFAEAWRGRLRTRLSGHTVYVIGLAAYLKNKRAAGRTKDLLDLALLEEMREKRKP
jgi:hypothetical protein